MNEEQMAGRGPAQGAAQTGTNVMPGAPVPPEQEVQPQKVATKAETDRKCPACGGTMNFDPASSGLLCPYCGHAEAIEHEQGKAEQDFSTAEETGNFDWGVEKKTVSCKSCGAESVYDALEIADVCPYCGSNQVMEERGKNTLAPGGVLPFKIDAKSAGQRFKDWLKRKLFCPTKAKQQAKPEKFVGVYLPYWTFDAQTSTDYSGQYGKNRTVRDREGKTRVVTDWYPVFGTHHEFIDDQLVSGTSRHSEDAMLGLQPFDTAANLAYKPEYVAGFVAERYSIGIKDAWERAKQFIRSRLQGNIESEVRSRYFADSVNITSMSTTHYDVKFKYLLLPVWMSSFTFNGKVYQFMVNGQTGRVSGKTPISPLRVAIAVALGLLFVGGMYFLFSYFGEGSGGYYY